MMFRSLERLFLMCLLIAPAALRSQDFMDIAENEKLHYSNLKNASSRTSRSSVNIDIIYDRLHLDPNVKTGYLKGNVMTCFKTLSLISNISLDLRRELKVDSVIYHSQKIAFTHTSDLFTISLPGNVGKGQIDSVQIFYQGKPSFVMGSYEHNAHNNVPIVHTLSEPYGSSYWWPCKETLGDKIDSIDVFVIADTGNLVAGNGILVSKNLINDSQILCHWKHRYPIATYLVAFAVTNYRQFSDFAPVANHTKTLEILNYVYPESYDVSVVNAKAAISQMTLYDSLFGTYPFSNEKYGHAQFPRNGGMEHQTMSFMGNLRYDLVAHEMAHQWFGDKVTCGTWQDLWLNEGFATYCNMLCYQYQKPVSEWYGIIQSTRNNVMSSPGGSVFVYGNDTANMGRLFDSRLTYNKGAMVLHMLRWKLGSDNFYAGVRNYLNDPLSSYGFGRTSLLKKHLEQVSGLDLTQYFLEWYYSEGFPTYQITWSQNSSNNIKVKISQVSSHSSVAFFHIPVPVKFTSASGDTITVFDPAVNNETFNVNLAFKADGAVFDPELWLLAKGEVIDLNTAGNEVFSVYPNPFNDELSFLVKNSKVLEIRIIDMVGKQVYNKTYSEPLSAGVIENIPLKSLGNGVYLIEVKSDNKIYKQKIFKQ